MKIKTGDIFTIGIDENRIGVGQIINIPDKSTLIIAIFDKLLNKDAIALSNQIINSDIVLLGYTLDAKIYHNHWKIVGNRIDNLNSIYLPYYKLGTPPDDIFVVNYKGDIIRPSTLEEFYELEYQSVVSPIRYENALKAHFNMGEWKEEYDKLLYSYTLNSVLTVEQNNNKLKPT